MSRKVDLQIREDRAHKRMKWALKSEDARRINAALDLARSEVGIPILPDKLDCHPLLINCPNGTLDLQTGQLREHRQEDYLTKLCPTKYFPDATCPTWTRFLEDIFPATGDAAEGLGDQELICFVQRLLGLCLTGNISEQILPIFWGMGANGKSTLVNAILEALGSDYTMKANPELLLVHRGERHSTERMDLFGKRLVVASETPEGGRLNEALIKDLTGGERIRGRRMREDQWEFGPTHKLILLTNHKPEVSGTDNGIWRRLLLVPFVATFWNPDNPADREKNLPDRLKQDKFLPAKLRDEYEGILAWLVRGCLAWKRQGLQIPARVTMATQEYREAEDVVAQFLGECCLVGPDLRCRATPLYNEYKKWVASAGETPMKQKSFGDIMTRKEFKRSPSNGTWYIGVALRQESPLGGMEGSEAFSG